MWFYWMKIWATRKESVVQLHPHSDSNEWGLVSCWHEAVNSPGFWAGVISGDCSWTYWGAQIVSATGKATPPLRQRGTASLSSCLSCCNVGIVGPKVQTRSRGQGWKLLKLAPCLLLFMYLFFCLFILSTHCFVNTWEVSVPLPQIHSQPLSFPRVKGQRKKNQLTS